MILSSAPTNEAVMSNVGAVSAFTIKATAKSFQILSSGLYGNKERAIIRELSCNALDSHVAANNTKTPFVVHLPNSMEPYFSVRDFGLGLSHAQVVEIFTSFFTSTKTESNDFVGALGLGSKSPFSYTDNFTVTTVKDGTRGIYTAFIDGSGVPSIALMMSEESDQPNGVEVRFAVADRYDFRKFTDEAKYVFKFWKNRPTITGASGFEFEEPEFKDRDIVPGVHTVTDSRWESFAIMGNIAYPIDVPHTDTTVGKYRDMLDCGLVLEFNIGELDFQASREGLSYVPLTLNSIKSKLESVSDQLAIRIAEEADKIENLWERADYLAKRMGESLWKAATLKYIADSKFPLMDATKTAAWDMLHRFRFKESDLASQFNIVIRGFTKNRGQTSCSTIKPERIRSTAITQHSVPGLEWVILPEMDKYFVFNDTKVGAVERAKHHWRQMNQERYTEAVYVIEPVDKKKPVKQTEFLAAIMNPPTSRVMLASSLDEKDRAKGMGRNVSILRLAQRSNGGWTESKTMVWEDAGKAADYADSVPYYYLPLSGYASLGVYTEPKVLIELLKTAGIHNGTIYGVRKGDMETIKSMPNWIDIDTFVKEQLSTDQPVNVLATAKSVLPIKERYHWTVMSLIDSESPYFKFVNQFVGVEAADPRRSTALASLCKAYGMTETTLDLNAIEDLRQQERAINDRYPLISALSRYSVESAQVADYINMVDKMSPINTENT